ncbi:Gibberellin 2-beta-dioxygenase 8 [Heracleum sosnowskyi]|uniref:gibberellin 2beta-dioxygenase n=1 Tax=Heracleum sosnowskyi TaxID=360622 RepID=A0AAD8MCC8_9APIA|nr:Gibberellin 2-beta-dioxygenase 8 [Heracleum sosnowskyi]
MADHSKNFLVFPCQNINMESTAEPPFEETYKALIDSNKSSTVDMTLTTEIVEECELPLIDLSMLGLGESEREKCKAEIAKASQEWGFFQVVNHGISDEILVKMTSEQADVFKKSFHEKEMCFPAGTYRWGTPSATCLPQLSWSEAFHVPLIDISGLGDFTSISTTMEQFATTVSELAQKLAEILAEKLGHKPTFFIENCVPSTCYLRMNRYPPCPIHEISGLMPHTDSDFLTILHQDQIGGLQLVKDGKWFAVKPNPKALIINIGDLFQAWSNDVYKSVEHRVVTNKLEERFSTAYFLCPSYETRIQSCMEPSVYKQFSFREFRQQVQHDVKKLGYKVGLPRFII